LVKWIFLVLGLLFIVGALIHAHFTQTFLRESVTVPGTVVGMKPVHRARRRRITFAPVFRFAVAGGHPVTVVSNISSSPPAFKPDEVVTVHYRKDHPEGAKIDSFEQLWLVDVVLASVGVLFGGIGIAILATTRKRELPAGLAPADGSGIVRRG